MGRKLLVVPVFHSEAEMGTVRDYMRAVGESVFGKERWERHRADVERFWVEAERSLQERLARVDMKSVKLYQDGQVIDGPIGMKIVEQIADAGSKNHQILLELIKRGATLMRTESFELLKEEHGLVKAIATAGDAKERAMAAEAYARRKDSLLEERDVAIARNMARTLGEGELGILFIGAFHKVEGKLPPDIEVEQLGGETAKRLKEDLAAIERLAQQK